MGAHSKIRVHTRKEKFIAPCAIEMAMMLSCWASKADPHGTGPCLDMTTLFHQCMRTTGGRVKPKPPTINFHLRRFSKDL